MATRYQNISVLVILLLMVLALGRSIAVETPLGHDESVYAVGARAASDGTPDTGWGLHRPVGMRYLAAVGIAFGGTEVAMRVVPVIFGALFIVAFYLLGRRVVGGVPAIFATATLLTSANLLRRASELLSDIPSVCLTLLTLWIIIRECEREEGPTWWIALCAPLAAAAFYVRYGMTLALAAIAVSAAILWRNNLLLARTKVLALVGAGLLLLLPHFIASVTHTGSLFGIIKVGGKAAGRKYLGQGLGYYGRQLPHSGFGTLLSALAITGLIYGLWVVATRFREERAVVFLWIVALVHTGATGLLVHGEPRYIFLGISLFALLGARAVADIVSPSARYAPAAIGAALVLLLSHKDASIQATNTIRQHGERREQMLASAEWIKADADGEPCEIMSSYVPQLTWYAGCATYGFTKMAPTKQLQGLKARRRYVVFYEKGKRQPTGPAKKQFLNALQEATLIAIPDPSGRFADAEVFVLEPPPPAAL